MKALSVKQPWANLIKDGYKTIETRTWKTSYRGRLIICSSKAPDKFASPSGLPFLMADTYLRPNGVTICSVVLANCLPMQKHDEDQALCEWLPGLYAWIIDRDSIESLEPEPIKGQLGIFNLNL